MVPDADGAGAPSRFHARTDRQQVVRSADPTPETLYLTRILVLQARLVEAERALAETERDLRERERELAERERDLQHVIDRYEHVFVDHEDADHTTSGEPQRAVTDGGRTSDASATSSEHRSDGGRTVENSSRAGRLAARLRDELGLGRD